MSGTYEEPTDPPVDPPVEPPAEETPPEEEVATGPKPTLDENTYTTIASSDVRVSHKAMTEAEEKAAKEAEAATPPEAPSESAP